MKDCVQEDFFIDVSDQDFDDNEDKSEYKVYKEKPYFNSDKDPFGMTLNGKTKDYLRAHDVIKNLLVKNKKYFVGEERIKILDATHKKGMVIGIIEVAFKSGANNGNAELKVHNPSANKKKGATIELRKISGFEYEHVLRLKDILTKILDTIIAGDQLDKVIKNMKVEAAEKLARKITSKPKQFECEICNFKTKFSSALKSHMTRLHPNIHKDTKKRVIPSVECQVLTCGSTFLNERKLKEHVDNQHKEPVQGSNANSGVLSPSSSPPRKRPEYDNHVKEDVEDNEIDMIDVGIEAENLVNTLLEKRVKELEKVVDDMKKQKIIDTLVKERLSEENTKLKLLIEEKKNNAEFVRNSELGKAKLPSHLTPVPLKHLSKVRGYKLIFKAEGNGACLENSVAAHIHEDKDEGLKVKRRVNNHIADNWDNYYKYKISLPYVETVGVGEHAKVVTKNTKEEIIEFLKSDESLTVYSNHHELQAVANLYNINIDIFTYGGGKDEYWSRICPDPDMVAEIEAKLGKYIPDMALYHCYDSHYDLLVKDDSRLALLGFVAGAGQQEDTENVEKVNQEDNNAWVKVQHKKNRMAEKATEKLLQDIENEDEKEKDIQEEMILLQSKNNGYRRTTPQDLPCETKDKPKKFMSLVCTICSDVFMLESDLKKHSETKHGSQTLGCKFCDSVFKNESDLKVHIQNMHEQITIRTCEQCGVEFMSRVNLEKHILIHKQKANYCAQCSSEFVTKSELKEHINQVHEKKSYEDEWNCCDCPFQANEASVLLNHLRVTSHQPSKNLEKKRLFLDYKQCYTCKMEFYGYYNLMDHRKIVHPSKKKCRDFPGKCLRGDTCWWVHEEPMDVDGTTDKAVWDFKCDLCDQIFKQRSEFMFHRKINHGEKVLNCENYLRGNCTRNTLSCWFHHPVNNLEGKVPDNQVFQQAQLNTPPDPMSAIYRMFKDLCKKVENVDKKVENMEIKLKEMKH